MHKLLIVFLATLSLASAFAATAAHADELDQEVRAVARRLQCPICESVSVADSPSELAGQMRAVIRAKLQEGQSSDEIVAYFVDRYGESVLVEPPRHGVGLMVWLAPLVALLVGALALGLWLRPARRQEKPASPQHLSAGPAVDWQLSAARRELEDMNGGRIE
jgi:cytochrome c-type biogenesis protein CcmH